MISEEVKDRGNGENKEMQAGNMESSKSVAIHSPRCFRDFATLGLITDLLQEVGSKDCIILPVDKQHCNASSLLFVSSFAIISWWLAGWEREDTG